MLSQVHERRTIRERFNNYAMNGVTIFTYALGMVGIHLANYIYDSKTKSLVFSNFLMQNLLKKNSFNPKYIRPFITQKGLISRKVQVNRLH